MGREWGWARGWRRGRGARGGGQGGGAPWAWAGGGARPAGPAGGRRAARRSRGARGNVPRATPLRNHVNKGRGRGSLPSRGFSAASAGRTCRSLRARGGARAGRGGFSSRASPRACGRRGRGRAAGGVGAALGRGKAAPERPRTRTSMLSLTPSRLRHISFRGYAVRYWTHTRACSGREGHRREAREGVCERSGVPAARRSDERGGGRGAVREPRRAFSSSWRSS